MKYRRIGRIVLPLPQPTSKSLGLEFEGEDESNSGNSFNKKRLSLKNLPVE
jgi:hypothetical protein